MLKVGGVPLATAAAIWEPIISKAPWLRRLTRWVDAVPHPNLAIEFNPVKLSAVRWSKSRTIADCASEALPPDALVPSALEGNCKNSAAIAEALTGLLRQINAKADEDVALLLPDPVIRVFLQQFEDFPRSPREALPLLRWKLKKSLPFDTEQSVISYMCQAPAGTAAVPVVVAVAQRSVVREYETLLEAAGLRCGVLLSPTLAAVALLQGAQATLLARVCGTMLTTAIVQSARLHVYHCTELPMSAAELSPQILLEEIFPVVAYYQDTTQDTIKEVRLAGLGDRVLEFVEPLERELGCPVKSLLPAALADGHLRDAGRILVDREMEAMAGWMLNDE